MAENDPPRNAAIDYDPEVDADGDDANVFLNDSPPEPLSNPHEGYKLVMHHYNSLAELKHDVQEYATSVGFCVKGAAKPFLRLQTASATVGIVARREEAQERPLVRRRPQRLQALQRLRKWAANPSVQGRQVTRKRLSKRLVVVINCYLIAESVDLGPVRSINYECLIERRLPCDRGCDRGCDRAFWHETGLGLCMGKIKITVQIDRDYCANRHSL